MMTLIVIFSIILLVYSMIIRGRVGEKNLEDLRYWVYAHRGLHDKPFVPENSMPAFQRALDRGYGIELDVHLLKDGGLAVIHDSSLKRTAGADVNIEDLTLDQLQNYHLEGTTETIPTFRQVLNLYNGQAPLIIELKAANGNAAKLAEAVCNALKTYHGPYGIESFDPLCLLWLKRNRPDVIRGQLSQNFMKNPSGQGRIIDFILTFLLGNLLTKPDFIAYKFEDRKNLSNLLCLYLWRMQGASWTITKQENFETCVQEGLLPIFEQFEPKVFFEE